MDQHDVAVPTLLPAQIPRLLSSSNGSYSFPPHTPGQGPPRLGWLPCHQQQQQQADQLQQIKQQIGSKKSTSSSRRSIPTASRDANSSSSSNTGSRSPVDIACRVIGGVGLGAGVGGLVSSALSSHQDPGLGCLIEELEQLCVPASRAANLLIICNQDLQASSRQMHTTTCSAHVLLPHFSDGPCRHTCKAY